MSTTLILENHTSRLITDDEHLSYFLWKKLRFRDKNYFHSRLYKQKKWDGFHDFYSKESGRFLTGILPEVQLVLSHFKVIYETIDNREMVQWRVKSIDDQFLNFWLSEYNSNVGPEQQRKDYTLRDFQPEEVNGFLKYYRGLLVAPTGTGKTLCLISIIKCLPKHCPTLILSNRRGLSSDHYQELKNWGVQDIGRLFDKYKDPNWITCATWQSAGKLGKLLPRIKCLIVDEVHEMMSKQARKIYNKLDNACIRVGISGTPFKFGGRDKTQKWFTKGYFGPPIKIKSAEGGVLTVAAAQKKNMITLCRATFWPIHSPMLPYDIYIDAVTRGIAENYELHAIVTRLAKAQTGRTLILVERIAHGDILNNMIPGSLWVQGRDDLETRKEVIDKLKFSKEKCIAIATSGIFSAGINVFCHSIINTSGGQADHAIIQRIGRGLRPADDKTILNYHDFYFHINEYLEEHSKRRIKILKNEGHEVIIKDVIDF